MRVNFIRDGMTRTLGRVLVVAAAVLCAAGLVARVSAGAPAQDGIEKRIFVSVVEKDGTPVTDMSAADFDVREGGRPVVLTAVRRATAPLRVHIIVSGDGAGEFQPSVLRFVQMLDGQAQFAITSVLVQPARILDFTTDATRISDAIQKLGRRGTPTAGNQLLDAIQGALKDMAAPHHRGVLLVLRVGHEDPGTTPAERVRVALRQSGATLYVVSKTNASRTVRAGTVENIADAAEVLHQLNLVLDDGARDSGGYHREIPLTLAGTTLMQLANELRNQYEISYNVPSGSPGSARIEVTTTRRDVTVRAPRTRAD